MTAEYQFIIDTGVIVADTQDILEDVRGEFRAALGQNLNVDASTPQGALITAETLARTGVMKNNAEMANVINPDYSYGVFLDGIAALLGVTRGKNQSTVVTGVRVNGNSTTVIPANSRVQSDAGDIFVIQAPVTIPVGGTTDTAIIVSQEYGDIPVPVGTLKILDGVIGWGAIEVLGSSTVVPGTTAMSDAKLKNVRNQRLHAQGVGSSGAIQAAVLDVPNVTSCKVIENNTGQNATLVNGVDFTLNNAMWVCVAGTPSDADVAMALYKAHNGGCPWDYAAAGSGNPKNSPNGVSVVDPATGQTYNVKWVTPIEFDVYVRMEVSQNTNMANPEPAIRAACSRYATGQMDGEPGLVVGASVSAFEISGAVARDLPGIYIKKCEVAVVTKGSVAPTYPTGYGYEFPMDPYEQGLLAFGNVVVVTV